MKRINNLKCGRSLYMLQLLEKENHATNNVVNYMKTCSDVKDTEERHENVCQFNCSDTSADFIENTPPDTSHSIIVDDFLTPIYVTENMRVSLTSPSILSQENVNDVEKDLLALEQTQHTDFLGTLIDNTIIENTPPKINHESDQNPSTSNTVGIIPSFCSQHSEDVIIFNDQPSTSAKNHSPVNLEDDLYLSDDSVADPNWLDPNKTLNNDSTNDSITSQDEIIKEGMKKKKIKTARWHKSNPEKYERNIERVKRSQCLPFQNYKRQVQPAKAPKTIDCKCRLGCPYNFTLEDRITICQNYWALADYKRQKDFIFMNVKANLPKRIKTTAFKKRTTSRLYFFQKEGKDIRICENFFKATLCISNGPINKAFSEIGQSGNFEGQDRRGKHIPHNKTTQQNVNYVKAHIEKFPKMESHYCRKTSSKLYLDQNLTISKMHQLYVEECENTSRVPVSENVYRKIFCTEFNLDFHKPKKDLCLLCHKYNTAKRENTSELAEWQEQYNRHIALKNQSQEAKSLDKVRSNEDESFMSITLDLQKVLHLPNSNVSLLYYLRKLNVYNATIYEARDPNDGYCFIWNETNGKKGSDEIGTAIYLWIQRLPEAVKEISIFSDTCAGQNRNQYLLSLLLYLVQTTKLEIIEHKYLESGHSHMEVDSMHSAIEHQLTQFPVYSMIDLTNVIKLARSRKKSQKSGKIKKAYEPVQLYFSDIIDLKDLKNNLIRNKSLSNDGEVVQWLKVKCFRFEKAKPNIVMFRYDYESPYKEFDVSLSDAQQKSLKKGKTGVYNKNLRKRKRDENSNYFVYDDYKLKNAYSQPIPITKSKKKDLLKMCDQMIIPSELHHWYSNLPDQSGPDYVPEDDCSSANED